MNDIHIIIFVPKNNPSIENMLRVLKFLDKEKKKKNKRKYEKKYYYFHCY